jgi:hypothetical protein
LCLVYIVEYSYKNITIKRFLFAEIACPELEAPINGALAHDSVLTRPLRIMSCNNLFDIPDMGTNFNGQFLCKDDGNWTPFDTVPDCIGKVYKDNKVSQPDKSN